MVESMARSFLYKSDSFQCFFTLYKRSIKMRMKGTEVESQVVTDVTSQGEVIKLEDVVL